MRDETAGDVLKSNDRKGSIPPVQTFTKWTFDFIQQRKWLMTVLADQVEKRYGQNTDPE